MSREALKEYGKATKRQQTRNDARTIRTKVEDAKRNLFRAGVRWPFELMQNAHDAGPRDGDKRIKISFTFKDNNLLVSHTGKPFTTEDLAALLSGGSSKDFDDEKTTGRFGTGFLVTHALSTHVDVHGVIEIEKSYERFHIELDRDGDEDAIAKNIEQADEAIGKALPLPESCIAKNPTASFIYYDADCEVAKRGLDRLEHMLPYLYVTCEKFGQVRIERPHGTKLFKPANTTEEMIDDFVLKLTEVTISQDETTRQRTALRIGSQNAQSALLVVLENCDCNRYRVILPEDSQDRFPRIFVKFPITETDFLPFNVVLDGSFDTKQERDVIAMNQNDRDLVSTAMEAFPTLIQYAVKSQWRDAHKLAHLAIPERTLGGGESDELEWWENVISKIGKVTAAKPIIDTEVGLLPALDDDGKNVTFLVPATDSEGQNPIDYDTIHQLASQVIDLYLPDKALAQDWSEIALQWKKMGLPIARMGLTELTDWVKEKGQDITDLPISGDPFKWLADLFLVIADLPESVNVRPIVAGLVPNQHSQLRGLSDLRIDEDIPKKIKDIADDIGIDLRSELLHKNVVEALDEPGYESAKAFIFQLLGESYTETEAVDNILDELDEYLPNDSGFDKENDLPALRASARLAIYLAGKDDNVRLLRKCPLLTADNKVIRLTGSQQILSPVLHWPQSTQPYVDLYTKNRLLSDHYCNDSNLNDVLIPLIEASLVIEGPLYQATRTLDSENLNLLKAMALDSREGEGVTVRNEDFGQIAFLSTDIVNRCGHDTDLAKNLLDFVLNVAAREDSSWQKIKEVTGNRSGDQVKLSLRGATWPFELKVRSWVPVSIGEEGSEGFAPAPANEANLRELLDPSWLQNNPHGIDLLHRVFGFRQLTLMTENLEPEVENNLVKLLQDPTLVKAAVTNLDVVKAAVENPETVRLISEADPGEIQEIREELKKRNRQAEIREYNRSFGHTVQAMLAEVIQLHGLDLQLVDKGYDYKVLPGDSDSILDNALFSFEVGSYFLEVKTTTTGDVRLTPLQAQTASAYSGRFVLCVIDLRGQEIPESWDLAKVKQSAKIVTDIGNDIFKVYEGVDKLASIGNPRAIAQ